MIAEDIKYVIDKSEYVSINKEAIKSYARALDVKNLEHWTTISPFDINQLNEKDRLAFLFVLDSISFCYWGNPKWTIQYKKSNYDGAKAMMVCIGKAIGEKKHILDFEYLSRIKRQELGDILMGNVEIPLLKTRVAILNEVGWKIQEYFKGDLRRLIDNAVDAPSLASSIERNFNRFRDCRNYEEKSVVFNKKIQLLAGDISHFFNLDNTDELTACADYKIPQILRRHKILEYDRGLQDKIISYKEVLFNSKEEIEIRANTIYAIELIKNELESKYLSMKSEKPKVTSQKINDQLWLEGQIKLPADEPYHRTITENY